MSAPRERRMGREGREGEGGARRRRDARDLGWSHHVVEVDVGELGAPPPPPRRASAGVHTPMPPGASPAAARHASSPSSTTSSAWRADIRSGTLMVSSLALGERPLEELLRGVPRAAVARASADSDWTCTAPKPRLRRCGTSDTAVAVHLVQPVGLRLALLGAARHGARERNVEAAVQPTHRDPCSGRDAIKRSLFAPRSPRVPLRGSRLRPPAVASTRAPALCAVRRRRPPRLNVTARYTLHSSEKSRRDRAHPWSSLFETPVSTLVDPRGSSVKDRSVDQNHRSSPFERSFHCQRARARLDLDQHLAGDARRARHRRTRAAESTFDRAFTRRTRDLTESRPVGSKRLIRRATTHAHLSGVGI